MLLLRAILALVAGIVSAGAVAAAVVSGALAWVNPFAGSSPPPDAFTDFPLIMVLGLMMFMPVWTIYLMVMLPLVTLRGHRQAIRSPIVYLCGMAAAGAGMMAIAQPLMFGLSSSLEVDHHIVAAALAALSIAAWWRSLVLIPLHRSSRGAARA